MKGSFLHPWTGKKHTDEQKRKIGESVSKNYNYNCNRKSGRGIKGWYKGFYCSSSYELAYVIYCLDHNIPIKRYSGYFLYKRKDGSVHRYYPDFMINDTIIEIKGFNNGDTLLKRDAVLNSGIKYKILYYNDLLEVFDYIEKKYNKLVNVNISDLYEKTL